MVFLKGKKKKKGIFKVLCFLAAFWKTFSYRLIVQPLFLFFFLKKSPHEPRMTVINISHWLIKGWHTKNTVWAKPAPALDIPEFTSFKQDVSAPRIFTKSDRPHTRHWLNWARDMTCSELRPEMQLSTRKKITHIQWSLEDTLPLLAPLL